jgi:hypothetical protein
VGKDVVWQWGRMKKTSGMKKKSSKKTGVGRERNTTDSFLYIETLLAHPLTLLFRSSKVKV